MEFQEQEKKVMLTALNVLNQKGLSLQDSAVVIELYNKIASQETEEA